MEALRRQAATGKEEDLEADAVSLRLNAGNTGRTALFGYVQNTIRVFSLIFFQRRCVKSAV